MNTIVALQRLFRDVFDDDNLAVAPETSRDDVEGWDSVAQVKLVLAAEEAFGINPTTTRRRRCARRRFSPIDSIAAGRAA